MAGRTFTTGYRIDDVNLKVAPLDAKCSITSPKVVVSTERRQMFRALPYGTTPDRSPIHVDSRHVPTQEAGVQQRICRVTPGAMLNRIKLSKFKTFVKTWVAKHLTPLQSEPSFDDWVDNAPYTQERKNELRQCHLDLNGSLPTRKHRRKIASFIKSENYPEFKHARWINSRSDHFKAYSGPWFSAIEKQLFALPWFIKYVPIPERASKVASLMREGARYLATDYTSFEAHFHPLFQKSCEGILYNYMLKNFPIVADCLTSTIFGTNHGTTRAGVSFIVQGRRMSGDMCTSLGNGFSNLMIWSFLMSQQHGSSWDGFVEGDDGIFAIYNGRPPSTEEYAELGFTIKIEEGDDPRSMSFCGIIAADGQNIRSPADFLDNFGWTSSFTNAGDNILQQLLRAKALSAAWETPSCPIIRSIAQRALTLTRGVAPRFVQDGYHDKSLIPKDESKLPPFAPTPLTRSLFSDRFGIDPITQVELERDIASGVDLGVLDRHLTPNNDALRFSSHFVLRY